MGSVIFIIIAYLACMLITKGRISGDDILVFTIAIVVIVVISEIIRKRFEHKGRVGQKEWTQMQANLNELRKSVAEIREYVVDLYIQQNDQKLK